MNFDELTNEEQIIFSIFKKLLGDVGRMHSFAFDKINRKGGFCVYKENNKWVSYIYDRDQISGYREYDSLYKLCIEIFEILEKKATDYCMEKFPILVSEALKETPCEVHVIFKDEEEEKKFSKIAHDVNYGSYSKEKTKVLSKKNK